MTQIKKEQLKHNVLDTKQWLRLVTMLVFFIILWPVSVIVCVTVTVQVLFSLVLGQPNPNIQIFARQLVTYLQQILLFLTYSDDGRPFPFAPWGQVDSSSLETASREIVDEQGADK